MRFLFVSYKYPGPLAAMATWIAAQPDNQVIFAAVRSRQDAGLANVQRVILKRPGGKGPGPEAGLLEMWEDALKSGMAASSSFERVHDSGFDPDMIFSAAANGTTLGIRTVFPDAFWVNFLEDENFVRQGQALLRREIQSLQILECQLAYAFSDDVRAQYTPLLSQKISLAPRVFDTEYFRTDDSGQRPYRLLIFLGRPHDLDYAREALPPILAGTSWEVGLVCQNSFFARAAQALAQSGSSTRVRVENCPGQEALKRALISSRAAFFPSRQEAWPLLACMSCAVAPLLRVRPPFLQAGQSCLVADSMRDLVDLLASAPRLDSIGRHAALLAREEFSAARLMPDFYRGIEKQYQYWNGEPSTI